MQGRKTGYVLIAAAIVLLVALAGSANAEDKSPAISEDSLQKMYTAYLQSEGYQPEIDNDGDVKFKHEGMVYYVIVDEKDLEYFRLVLPNIWLIESEAERQKVLVAADVANAKAKVAKVNTVRDNVWVSIELFMGDPEAFRPIFKRSLLALQNAASIFGSEMKSQ